ncbi:YidH family protein [Comamonas testosteroni]|uniref:YidH family protein n=1 Tax=Comamonas testosteroni TaxID=285 RepID=UPI0026E94AD2|nr:DUF202 domain-containing protein [Comamonas testosteroni]
MSRRPVWREEGEEPDYRFSLANERTFLAWIRTALAILAAGILLDQFSTKLSPHNIIVGAAVLLCLVAALLCLMAYLKWRGNEIAMRHKRALPHSGTLGVLAALILALAALVAFLILKALHSS